MLFISLSALVMPFPFIVSLAGSWVPNCVCPPTTLLLWPVLKD